MRLWTLDKQIKAVLMQFICALQMLLNEVKAPVAKAPVEILEDLEAVCAAT